jgi:Flp pilus assembly protein TadD
MTAKLSRQIWSAVLPMVTKTQLDDARNLEAASGYIDLSMPEHALRALDQVSDREAAAFEYYWLRGDALRTAGNFEEALAALSRAREEQPDELSVLMAMAWCYKRTDRLSQAISAMEEAYRAHPKVAIVLYNMACYYSLADDKMQALSWLGRALRMQTALRQRIAAESDFDPLRNDPDFQYLTNLEYLTDL